MATLLRPLLLRPQTLGLGLGLTLFAARQHYTQTNHPVLFDTRSPSPSILNSDSYSRNASTPVVRDGALNPGAVRQISSGSMIGLCAGLVVSTFSKPLALILGLMVVGVQWASSYGIHIIPYNRLQKYVTSMNLRSTMQDNVAFKISFGTTFAMAAFMQF